jgi:hypothetical protein
MPILAFGLCLVLVELITQFEQLIDFAFLLVTLETGTNNKFTRAVIGLFPARRNAIILHLGFKHAITAMNNGNTRQLSVTGTRSS